MVLVSTGMAALSFGSMLVSKGLPETTNTAHSILACTGGDTETFTNMPANSTAYATKTWTGDNSVAWSATDSRTDQTLTGRAITLRTGVLKNTVAVAGGIGTLNFNYKRVFTGNSTLKVFVNGVQRDSITVSSETTTLRSLVINATGNVNIEFRNTGNRTIIDDVTWDCFGTVATAPQLQLVDASNNNVACGALNLDFGSHEVAVSQDLAFTVKNTGTAALVVSSLALSGANSADFSIVSPAAGFSVPASGSTVVLARFTPTSGGAKTAVLTINSNSATAACTVNFNGTGLAACTAPVGTVAVSIPAVASTGANVSVTGVTAAGYIAVLAPAGYTDVPEDGIEYEVGSGLGADGLVVYVGTDSNFTIPVGDQGDYIVYVFPYNSGNCLNGPVYGTAGNASFTIPCFGGLESFTNLGTESATYMDRTWTGDVTSWSATDSRNDQILTGSAIALRAGTLKNTTPISGIGSLTFSYKRVFTGGTTLKVLVNGDQYGSDINVVSDVTTIVTENIQVSGDAVISIVNAGTTGGRVIIDDLSWTCYEAPSGPHLQLVDNVGTQRACGAYTLNFGNTVVNTNKELTFDITNTGDANLSITSIVSADPSFTITSALPSTLAPSATATITANFNTTGLTLGNTYSSLVTITSNAGTCTLNLAGTIAEPCATPASATIAISNETYSSADVTLTGSTANGYIAVVSPTAFTGVINAAGFPYTIEDVVGNGTVAYVGTSSTFTVTAGIFPDSNSIITVFPYNIGTECVGPIFAAASTGAITTPDVLCGGSETFTNLGTNSTTYVTRTWTGDNGVSWSATDSRNDQTLTGRAITLRTGVLQNTSFAATDGAVSLSFNYKRVFTGNSTLKVFVNGVQYGGNIAVTADTVSTYNQVLSVTGPVTIRIENTGNRVVIDDLVWECNTSFARSAKGLNTSATSTMSVNEVQVYPNPNNGQFQLYLPSTTDAEVTIYDTLGKKVFGKKVAANEMIDLGQVQKGIYIVSVLTGNEVSNKRIIVK